MVLTLANHRGKHCPEARVVDGVSEDHGVAAVNRLGEQRTTCLGPPCAAWDWLEAAVEVAEREDATDAASLASEGWTAVGQGEDGMWLFVRPRRNRAAQCGKCCRK